MIHAVLSNPTHPEYGQATIPFPIPTEEYDHVLEVLAPLGIGDALQRDCRVDELTGGYPILKRLEDTNINLDELDYISYHGTMSLDELMMEGPAEQYQRNQGLQIGGMA